MMPERLLQKCDDVKALQLLANDKTRPNPIDREKHKMIKSTASDSTFRVQDIMTRDEKARRATSRLPNSKYTKRKNERTVAP